MVKKVLIADDDKEFCEEISEVLENRGYKVNVESDGFSCEREVRKNEYDIFLLDYKMPGLNGVEILKIIKEKAKESKVFIITGKHDIENTLKIANVDNLADGFLNKPFNVEEFLALLENKRL